MSKTTCTAVRSYGLFFLRKDSPIKTVADFEQIILGEIREMDDAEKALFGKARRAKAISSLQENEYVLAAMQKSACIFRNKRRWTKYIFARLTNGGSAGKVMSQKTLHTKRANIDNFRCMCAYGAVYAVNEGDSDKMYKQLDVLVDIIRSVVSGSVGYIYNTEEDQVVIDWNDDPWTTHADIKNVFAMGVELMQKMVAMHTAELAAVENIFFAEDKKIAEKG